MSRGTRLHKVALAWAWRKSETHLRILSISMVVFFGGFSAFVLWDIFALSGGEPEGQMAWEPSVGVFPLVFSLFVAGCVVWRLSRAREIRWSSGLKNARGSGALIPRKLSSAAVTLLLSFSAVWMLASAPWWVGLLDDPSGRARGALFAWLAQTFGPVIAIPFLVYGLSLALHWRFAGLEIDRNGICLLSPLGRLAYDWNSISGFYPNRSLGNKISVAVQQSRGSGVADPRENLLTRSGWVRGRYGRSFQTVHLRCDPAVVYQALQYYLRHADKREELGTEAGLERIRQGRFEDINKEINLHGDIVRP